MTPVLPSCGCPSSPQAASEVVFSHLLSLKMSPPLAPHGVAHRCYPMGWFYRCYKTTQGLTGCKELQRKNFLIKKPKLNSLLWADKKCKRNSHRQNDHGTIQNQPLFLGQQDLGWLCFLTPVSLGELVMENHPKDHQNTELQWLLEHCSQFVCFPVL